MVNGKVSVCDKYLEDPNADLIVSFIRRGFPELRAGNVTSIMEAVVDELIGSRQTRLAGRPALESEVAMRALARRCIERGERLPVLVVSGPKKPKTGESVDMAELSALKQLSCLNKRIKEHYPPGLDVRVRLEDVTGYYLEIGLEGLRPTIETYIEDFTNLVYVAGYDDFITPIPESQLVSPGLFRDRAESILPSILTYLSDSEQVAESDWENLSSFKDLQDLGWQGKIPRAMRDFYRNRYEKLYPGEDQTMRIAKYLATTLARYQLKATGTEGWNGNFQINFAPPAPGIPESLTSTRLYYRTAPLCQTKNHMPYWRAKGYLKLNGHVRMSLTSWSELPEGLREFYITLSRDNRSVKVRADYVEEVE